MPSSINWFLDIFQRIKLACSVLVAPANTIAAQAGQLISYDPVNRRLVIEGDFEIHATGNLYLNSDQHVVVRSGNDGGQYTHQIHLNPVLEDSDAIHVEVDQYGSPREQSLQPSGGSQGLDAPADHGEHTNCGHTIHPS